VAGRCEIVKLDRLTQAARQHLGQGALNKLGAADLRPAFKRHGDARRPSRRPASGGDGIVAQFPDRGFSIMGRFAQHPADCLRRRPEAAGGDQPGRTC